jgi:transposase
LEQRPGELLMSQAERDRLVALKKAKEKRITQGQAAEELGVSERQVRRMLAKMRKVGDKAIVHGLRGRSNRKLDDGKKEQAIEILKQDVYRGFGPTLASEYLAKKHALKVSKETVRKWMREAGLWRAEKQRVAEVHMWRQRRERYGEMVQWDTSEHDWLEGRGEKIYLIKMIDDATSRLFARFVRSDSTADNMAVLEAYLLRFGRPLQFYTDKASIFVTTPKKNHPVREEALPPTQIGRALGELNIGWIAAHSPQAKGRVERSFETAQDRLVKGLRVAGAKTLEEANVYLEAEYLPQWETKFTVVAACSDDAHRSLEKQHDLAAILSEVEQRVITNDYTIRHGSKVYQIVREDIRPRMRRAAVRVEARRNGEIGVRFEHRYVRAVECRPAPKADAAPLSPKNRKQPSQTREKSKWMKGFWERPSPSLSKALKISNATN